MINEEYNNLPRDIIKSLAKMEKIIVEIIGRIRLIPGVGRYVQHIPAMHGVPLIVKGEFRLTVQGDDQQIFG